MGQFLHIGLIYQSSVDKDLFDDDKISFETFEKKMKKRNLIDLSLYEREKEEYKYVWTLKEDVLEKHLFSLLKEFYPFAYFEMYKHCYYEILKEVEGKTGKQLVEFGNESSSGSFQIIYYFENGYTFFGNNKDNFPSSINWSFRPLILTTEGKISMEESGATFNLFARSLKSLFRSNPLSKSFVVYIGG